MRICLLGDFSRKDDEGLKNIARNLFKHLSGISSLQVLNNDLKDILHIANLRKVKDFRPDILHYVPGPTNKSFVLLRFLMTYLNHKPKIVMSAPHPLFNDLTIKLLRVKPDFVMAPSHGLGDRLSALGISYSLLPNGVDLERFRPVSSGQKMLTLRDAYGFHKNEFTILHVGHITTDRNLETLVKLSRENQVVVVGSSYLKTSRRVRARLQNAGCRVIRGYLPNIEEFYQMADCYVFPVRKGRSIMCPLSVMEAMACNLPVVSTRFEGLETFFREGNGLYYSNPTHDDIQTKIDVVKERKNPISTRELVEEYSWENISRIIAQIYASLVDGA